jgi:hypothetical protein
MSVRVCAALAAVVCLACCLVSSAGAALPTLYVHYAMNCTFTIVDDSGKTVTSLAPGAYQIAVSTPVDFAGEYVSGSTDFTACMGFVQFQLTGPGVSVHTTLDDGDASYDQLTATFGPSSTYTAQDNNQPAVARAVFTTLASGTPASPQAPANPAAPGKTSTTATIHSAVLFRGTIDATVSARGALSLRRNGAPVTALKSGRWTIAVADRSKTAGFSLQALHGKPQALTSGAFTGSARRTVVLQAGRWSFFTAGGAKSTFFVLT